MAKAPEPAVIKRRRTPGTYLFAGVSFVLLIGATVACTAHEQSEITVEQYAQVREWYSHYPKLQNIINHSTDVDRRITYAEFSAINDLRRDQDKLQEIFEKECAIKRIPIPQGQRAPGCPLDENEEFGEMMANGLVAIPHVENHQ